ncbi:MAG TPA: DNA-processing protein DprA [Myxococcaceae bacterium]|nr:DNA-processing protein DprA [Myxococcaceae bacterium]
MTKAAFSVSVELERLAALGLWTVPGVGPEALKALRACAGGALAPLLAAPVADYAQVLPAAVRARMQGLETVEPLAELALRRCAKAGIQIAWPGDAAYPAELAQCPDAPPLLFHFGTPGPGEPGRRRLAMVGSRHPDAGFLLRARAFAREVAQAGALIVSGAADGVDRACHFGALDARQETWAFVGSALDELDSAQAKMLPAVLAAGGAYFSELPPGVRASKESFPRRNRLISGAAHAVLVLRAGARSGALYTAAAALRQGRPLYALPGDADNEAAAGCNALLAQGAARACTSSQAACRAVGLRPAERSAPPPGLRVALEALSGDARAAHAHLVAGEPRDFEALLSEIGGSSGTLTGALCELELAGRVVQLPGKRYERVD